jgi:hypothetical protein
LFFAAQQLVPPATLHPGGVWVFNWVIPIVASLFLVLATADVIRRRRLNLNYEVTIPRWGFELMRLGAWFVVFQVTFFVFLVVPLVVMRAMTGSDSPYIP